jgi:hypothetical protein
MPEQTVVVELGIFLAGQTAAFIFYAGVVIRQLKEHERRLDLVEAVASKQAADMAYMRGKESIQP